MVKKDNLNFRKANENDALVIWEILQDSIERRKKDGSTQWQGGYPNFSTVKSDIEHGFAYVLEQNKNIFATSALIFNNEPTYENIDGKWLTNGDFLVIHRVGISNKMAGKGLITKFFELIEQFALDKQVFSIKADTNFDNLAMLRIFEKLDYTYCGEIQVYDGKRKAFEKILKQN